MYNKLPEAQETSIEKSSSNNDKSLVGHIVKDLGGVLFAVEAIDKTLDFAGKGFKNNKFYQSSIKLLRGMSPVFLTGYKIKNSVNNFYRDKKQQYAQQRKSYTILKLMGMEYLDEYELDYWEFSIGKEIIDWMTSRPKTDNFKIIEFYNDEFDPINSKNFDAGSLYILIEYENNKYMIESEVQVMNQQIFVSKCWIHTTCRYDKMKDVRTAIFSEFIKYFDTSKNVIEMTSKGLSTRPRMGFDYDVEQFDVSGMKSEIEKAIKKNKKRGYIMVGPPGVGKSTVIIKLEKELPDIPIVYISSSGNVFREDVINIFNFLRSISPCIAIFEDLDSYELSNKQDRTFGEFIEQMDSLKHKECVIIMATLNEPENVHSSLINRRGRFDKVYFINYPKSASHILNVMKNRYKNELSEEIPISNLPNEFITKMVKHNFTQADICEVVDYLIINDIEFTEKNIDKSIDGVIQTMLAVNKCEEGDD